MTILIFCQFLRAVSGPSVQLLTVIGAQRLNAVLCLVALALLVVSNVILAPLYGVTGAASAVALSWLVWLTGAGNYNCIAGPGCEAISSTSAG